MARLELEGRRGDSECDICGGMAKRVTPSEAAGLLKEGWQYVDVRTISEFEAGHPEGALNIPFMHMTAGRMVTNPDFVGVVLANFAPEDKLVLGCKVGGRSLQAAALLEALGFSRLVDVHGGFSGERDSLGRITAPGWQHEGLPVSHTPAAGSSYEERKKKVPR